MSSSLELFPYFLITFIYLGQQKHHTQSEVSLGPGPSYNPAPTPLPIIAIKRIAHP